MKKIFTLFFALFIMAFCAKAQQTLLQEGFETSTLPTGWTIIDNDNDGYNWFPTLSVTENYSYHSGSGCITSASWDSDAGALTPDNWLITPAINLTSNATLTFWVVGQDPSYAAENYSVYVATSNTVAAFTATTPVLTGTATDTYTQQTVNLSAYTGQTVYIAFRHHNVTDMFMLNIDDVEIFAQPTSPTISAAPATIDFGTVGMPGSKIESTTISAYSLTADITATTSAPFEVSADGTTYGTTATIAQTGGTLYVKYTPTAAGSNNGTVTLSSTGATSVTLTLTGNAVDCSNTPLPYTTNFTNDALNNCWTIVDANNDGDPQTNQGMWNFMVTDEWAQYFFHGTNAANDWLISPVFDIPQTGAISSFDYKVRSSTYPEKFSVWVIPANGSYLNAIQIVGTRTVTNTAFETQYLDLASYAGQSIQIAIKAESDPDMYGLNISNFFIGAEIPTTMTVTPTAIDFGGIPAGMTVENMIIINSANLNEAINVTTAAPYSVSLNGTSYNTTVTIPANPALSVDDTIYVKFAPTTPGTYNDNIIISTTTLGDTVLLTGSAADCNTITTFPFTEDFEETSPTLPCWTVNDANNDGKTFSFTSGAARYTYSSANPADDWVISPEITFTGSQILSVDYRAQSANYPEKFMVAAINGNTITVLTDTIHVTLTSNVTEYVDLSSLNGTYKIGIHCVSDPNQYYLFIDNFAIIDVSEASLAVNPDSLTFIGIMGQGSLSQEVDVTGFALTSSISVSAPANFEISTDNTSFGATATIANTGMATQASLYVRINAATAGLHSGNITLTSGTATATIYVEGNAVDCSGGIASLPFTHTFNDQVAPPTCWGYNDMENFDIATVNSNTGDYAIVVLDADYLISPEIHSTAAMNMSIDYRCYYGDQIPGSTFRIGYSSTNDNYTSFTWLEPFTVNAYPADTTAIFDTYTTLIPAGSKFVAVDITEIGSYATMFGSYYNYLFFDNFSLTEVNDPIINPNTTNINFGSINVNTTETETVAVITANLTADITATTTTPFEVSADNTTFGATATIPAVGGNLYVRYAPTAVGTHTGTITLSSAGATSVQISLNGNGINCSNAQIPYFTDFSDEGMNQCWTIVDANNDGSTYEFNTEEGYAIYVYNENNNADDWLISPVFNLGINSAASFDYIVANETYPERFAVYVIAAGQTYQNATQVVAPTDATNDSEWLTQNIDLTAFANQSIQIAIKCISDADEYLFGVTNFTVTDEVAVKEYDNNISVYPNPANNVINVNSTSNISNVEVYTITGQKVGDFTANNTNIAINTSNLTNGLYLMQIHTENGVINKKFSVVR